MGMSQDLGPQIYHSILSTFARKPSTLMQKKFVEHSHVSITILVDDICTTRPLVIPCYIFIPLTTHLDEFYLHFGQKRRCEPSWVMLRAGADSHSHSRCGTVSTWPELGNQNLNKISINEIWLESHQTLWIRNGITTFLYKTRSSSALAGNPPQPERMRPTQLWRRRWESAVTSSGCYKWGSAVTIFELWVLNSPLWGTHKFGWWLNHHQSLRWSPKVGTAPLRCQNFRPASEVPSCVVRRMRNHASIEWPKKFFFGPQISIQMGNDKVFIGFSTFFKLVQPFSTFFQPFSNLFQPSTLRSPHNAT